MVLAATACRPAPAERRFDLTGQVIGLRPEAREVTIRHDDIKGFMPAMTMPFTVREARLLEGLAPGDLVKGTLIVLEDTAYLSALSRTGHADLPPASPPPVAVALYRPGETVPDETFVDQDGRDLSLGSLRGKAVALTFIYTRCPLPEFCPLMDRQFAAVQKAVVADARLRGAVRLLSVSFDPEFDTPAVLAAHARQLGAEPAVWSFVTADRTVIDRFASGFGLTVMRGEGGGPGSIVHNLRTGILDAEGRLVKIYSGSDWTPDQVIADLQHVVGR
jgi:protein SCO1/2